MDGEAGRARRGGTGQRRESWVTFRCKQNQQSGEQVREKQMKTQEQGVEAEMGQAESKPTVGLEKAETYGNAGMSDPAMGRNVVPGRSRGQAQR